MTCMMIILVFDVFYAILHYISKKLDNEWSTTGVGLSI